MPKFIERNAAGAVIAAWSAPRYPTQAALPDNDPALMAYLKATPASQKLMALDLTVDDLAQITTRAGLYVDRDPTTGLITAAWDTPQRQSQEFAPLELPELQRFLEKRPAPVAPEGYRFEYVNASVKWRIAREYDNFVMVQGLETIGACATAASRFVTSRHPKPTL